MDIGTLIDITDEPSNQTILTDAELYDYDEDLGAAPAQTPEPAAGTAQNDLPERSSIPPPTRTSPKRLESPYLASEPTTPCSQSPPPPIEAWDTLALVGYTPPPTPWTTRSLLVPITKNTEVILHWAEGLCTLSIPKHVLPSSSHLRPAPLRLDRPLPFYTNTRPYARPPAPAPRRPDTTTTPQTDPRTHPFKHYKTRTTSKSQFIPPELPDYRMILTNWAYALVALFRCSLPPHVLPNCMKWLLTTTRKDLGFSLTANALLLSVPALLHQHENTRSTTSANPNPTWDFPTPEPFMKLARPYLTKIGEAPTDATRHAQISQEPLIEQWLHVGLYLYPIETVAQQLFTVAYSYAVHILDNHPGRYLHDDHPTASLNVQDDDYLETHPFTVKYNTALHPIPITHPNPNATTPTGFIGLTTSTLFRRFRNLMRLRGILCSVVFIVRTHLSAMRRRAYTDRFAETLRDPHQALPSISSPTMTTVPLLNTHYTVTHLSTTYPTPYKNPVDMTTLKITPISSSNIGQGDPLTHLLHNTYHFDHRLFTISPQQDYSAQLTALYADLLQLPYLPPPEQPSPAEPTALYAGLQQLPYLPPMHSPSHPQPPLLRPNDFSSDDLPLQNHCTTIRSPPQSQATTEEMTDSEEEDQPSETPAPPPLSILRPPPWESNSPP